MSEPQRRIRGVTFDLGDTLWHFPDPPPADAVEEHFTTRVRHLLLGWGIKSPVTPEVLRQRLRETRAEADRISDTTDWVSPDYPGIIAQVTREAGLDLSAMQIAELWQAMNTGGHFLRRHIFEDTVPVLEWLRARGLRIGALTNRTHGGAVFLEELRQHDLLQYFDTVISSDQVGYRKPHPQIFRAALEALELPAEAVAHVGDRPDADVEGARRAGIYAIWMRLLTPPERYPSSEAQVPDATIEHLAELRSLPIFDQLVAD